VQHIAWLRRQRMLRHVEFLQSAKIRAS
jgi:hypothetical protein